MPKLSTAFAVLFLLCASIAAQTAPTFSPEIKRVAVFKNGYAFTYREGQARPAGGWAYTENFPVGVLGTVWGYTSTPGSRVVQLRTSESDAVREERVRNIAEFLVANKGKSVKINLNFDNLEYEGTYDLLMPEFERPENARFGDRNNGNYSFSLLQNMTIALKTERGTMVFPAATISTVEVQGDSRMTVPSKTNRLGVKLEGAKDGQSTSVGLAALERGIRWIPAYRIEVKGSPIKEAKLELEAMIINELTDLDGSEVFFVVGSPSFLFEDLVSPLSMNTAFAGVSSYFQTNNRSTYGAALMSNIARQSYSMDDAGSEDDGASPTVVDDEKLATFAAEQLFLYRSDALTLKKGERASLRLFSLTVPASEMFEWTIDDPSNIEQSYSNNKAPKAEELSSGIWSALRLKNTTEMPWTTGPAITFREWKPIGQNILNFTPVGGDRIVKVTPATEVIGTHELEEKDRERVQLTYGGSSYNFDLVTIEGRILVNNVKNESVELIITRNLVGEVLSAESDGKISRKGANLQSFNPNSTVRWEMQVPSGKTEFKYTYKVYVRR